MKRIAIIVNAFGGSTTSLAEAFLNQGYKVDFYHLIPRKKSASFETFDLSLRGGLFSIVPVRSFDYDGLRRFIPFARNKYFSMYQISVVELSSMGIRCFINPILVLYYVKLARRIIKQKYDFVNVIGQNKSTAFLSVILRSKGVNVVHSVHEVCVNHQVGDRLSDTVLYLIEKKIPINVFSQKTAEDLVRLADKKTLKYSVIPFSLFTGYLEYNEIDIPELKGETDYVPFYGFIVNYKGLDVLLKAAHVLMDRGFTRKIVVAGGGNVDCLATIKKEKNFIVINRWIENVEISTLIRKCHIVVCPYLSSSQTGITQTVFNFDKPIVATKVPAFTTTIEDGKTGLLVDVNDVDTFADAIIRSYQDVNLYIRMCHEVRSVRQKSESIWKDIVMKYVQSYING